jgi:hypothetical protein
VRIGEEAGTSSWAWNDDGESASGGGVRVSADADGHGLCLTATATLPPGTVLLREKPRFVIDGPPPSRLLEVVREASAGGDVWPLAEILARVFAHWLGASASDRAELGRFFRTPHTCALAVSLAPVVRRVQERWPALALYAASELLDACLIWLLSSHSLREGVTAWEDGVSSQRRQPRESSSHFLSSPLKEPCSSVCLV